MPTENRSSNTDYPHLEAASSAMTQIRTMLGREQRPDQLAAALESCDWSDTPIGNKAIILSAIRALRTKQPHPEPIAWMVGTAFWWTKVEAERDAAATGKAIVPFGPTVDNSEVERLRAALQFYADREHYHFESGNWDTVSGEPLNILWCGEEPDFIEDGTVARKALSASAEPSPIPDPLGCNECAHTDCGKFAGPRQVECRAMADNACARPGASS